MKTIFITQAMRQGIVSLKRSECLTSLQIAELAGVGSPTVCKWLNGKIERINVAYWAKLEPHVQPYMDVPQDIPGQADAEKNVRFIKVIRLAVLGFFLPAVEALSSYIARAAYATTSWQCARPGDFVVTVDDSLAITAIPAGSDLLVRGGDYPKPGDVVIAKLIGISGPVITRFKLRDPRVSLVSLSRRSDAIISEVNKDPGRIAWMYPVRALLVDVDRLAFN